MTRTLSEKKKWVYLFGEGSKDDSALLGGKGANLSEMTRLRIPVPPGFTITTEACKRYYENGQDLSARPLQDAMEQVDEGLGTLESLVKKGFGNSSNPLLVSVRSGAPVSMPGMMDTILNLGLNDQTIVGVAKRTGDEQFALDLYRRFIQMFGEVVLGINHELFQEPLTHLIDNCGVYVSQKLRKRGGVMGLWRDIFYANVNKTGQSGRYSTGDLKDIISTYKGLVVRETGQPFPSDVRDQLRFAIQAVFSSWNSPRAIEYRRIHGISDDLGTAVNVQAMVFGNTGENSGTGVVFTRNPSTGKCEIYGEFLPNAQGEDIVAGIRTPLLISQMKKATPKAYHLLEDILANLENHFKDMQDVEFTVEDGQLYILQTRNGKRTTTAAVRIAVEMVNESLIDEQTALLRVPSTLESLADKAFDPSAKYVTLGKGIVASTGLAVGRIAMTSEKAVEMSEGGDKVILVRTETSADDITGIKVCDGILTAKGGATSHAAVVARGMNKCCITGCGEMSLDMSARTVSIGGTVLKEGEYISLEGNTGDVLKGKAAIVETSDNPYLQQITTWARHYSTVPIFARAATCTDIEKARDMKPEGIDIRRTEHLFFVDDRLAVTQDIILDRDRSGSKEDNLKRKMKEEFKSLLECAYEYHLPMSIHLAEATVPEFFPPLDFVRQRVKQAKMRHLSVPSEFSDVESAVRVDGIRRYEAFMLYMAGHPEGTSEPLPLQLYRIEEEALLEAVTESGYAAPLTIILPKSQPKGMAEQLAFLVEEWKKIFPASAKACPIRIHPAADYTAEIPVKLPEGVEYFGGTSGYVSCDIRSVPRMRIMLAQQAITGGAR